MNQEWLNKNVPHYISALQWPSNSPDANPLDFSIWSILEARVCTKKYSNLESLKVALCREWKRIPEEQVRVACESFFERIDKIIKAKGGHIEQ